MVSSALSGEHGRAQEKARLLKQMTAIAHAVPARTNKKAIVNKYLEVAKQFLGTETQQKHG